MINHNIVVLNGNEYKAVKPNHTDNDLCSGCAIKGLGLCNKMRCTPIERDDERSVIFKPHHRPNASELKW